MTRKKKKASVGAVGSATARFFHPSAPIRERWPNDQHKKHRVTGVVVVRRCVHKINRRDQSAYECRIPDIEESRTFFIARAKLRIDASAPVSFEEEDLLATGAAPQGQPDPLAGAAILDARASSENFTQSLVDKARFNAEDIAALRAQGITVDDDNEPAPENAEAPPALPNNQRPAFVGEWVKPLSCPRLADPNVVNHPGRFKHHTWPAIALMSPFTLFRMCFFEDYVNDVIIPTTNLYLEGEELTIREFYCWLGCWLFMSCYEGIEDRRLWWAEAPIDMYDGAPFRLGAYMSRNRFEAITTAIRYTDKDAPTDFEDRFHDVRQMIDEFNEFMAEEYSPSWINCLDESMNSWLNKYCPGFMVVPRKPHPEGNEYHSIADGDDGKPIMWRVKLQEGKDRPKKANGAWAFPSEWDREGPTVRLMLEMTRPIHYSGKVVTMDSGFCVSAGILALHHRGVYGQALIKKRGRWWPKKVPGDQIDEYFMAEPLGKAMTLKQIVDGTQFMVHCHKDDRYVTKIMSTHGLINEVAGHTTYRQIRGEWKSFNYTEPISRHNRAKHWVDDVNNRRHDPIGLEDVWATKWWPNRQFTFLVSVAEVNALNAGARARKEAAPSQLKFRKALAKGMLENVLDVNGNVPQPHARLRKRKGATTKHKRMTRPKYTGGKWDSGKNSWSTVGSKYLKSSCVSCGFECRTYCLCNPKVTMCPGCIGMHIRDEDGLL